jgi:hypothetical protein
MPWGSRGVTRTETRTLDLSFCSLTSWGDLAGACEKNSILRWGTAAYKPVAFKSDGAAGAADAAGGTGSLEQHLPGSALLQTKLQSFDRSFRAPRSRRPGRWTAAKWKREKGRPDYSAGAFFFFSP